MSVTSFVTLLVVSIFTVASTALSVLLCLVARSKSRTGDLQPRDEQRRQGRSLFTFTFNPTPRHEYQVVASESMVNIQVSHSSPAIFGDETNEKGAVKVFVTPPTPAKKTRIISAARGSSYAPVLAQV